MKLNIGRSEHITSNGLRKGETNMLVVIVMAGMLVAMIGIVFSTCPTGQCKLPVDKQAVSKQAIAYVQEQHPNAQRIRVTPIDDVVDENGFVTYKVEFSTAGQKHRRTFEINPSSKLVETTFSSSVSADYLTRNRADRIK